jgi:hypothetical protein
MVVLFNLRCPAGHPVLGVCVPYASDNPPEAWLETMEDDFLAAICHLPEACRRCAKCRAVCEPGVRGWRVAAHDMNVTTLDEAEEQLGKFTERVEMPQPDPGLSIKLVRGTAGAAARCPACGAPWDAGRLHWPECPML